MNNKDRAKYGARAVVAGTPDFGQNDDYDDVLSGPQTDLGDALCNMMHHAKRAGLDFADAIRMAEMHFVPEDDGQGGDS